VVSISATFALEVALILVLIVANGIFSGSEIAIVSARKLRLEQWARQGNRQAAAALRLASSPNDFLSTVQIGITLIGILSGAVGGATLARSLAALIQLLPPLRPWSEAISLVLVVSLITYLSLVIGELLPKRIALGNPEAIACAVAGPMRWLARWGSPLVRLLGWSTEAMMRLLGIAANQEPDLTEDEIHALLRQGAESGVIDQSEHDLVQRVFHLADRPVRSIMTPRTEIEWIDLEASPQEQIATLSASSHGRFPVSRGHLDACVGILRSHGFLAARLADGEADLEALLQPAFYVTESAGALAVIDQFRDTGMPIALVTDEYGGIEGLVTLTDLIEAIVGDLPSREHPEDPPALQREDGSWLFDGQIDLHEFRQRLRCPALPGEESGSFHTLAGFLLHRFARVPRAGDQFSWNGLHFEVIDMDGQRIDKVLVGPDPQHPAA
jgi:putative hemolysin